MLFIILCAPEVCHGWQVFQTHQPIEMGCTGMNSSAVQAQHKWIGKVRISHGSLVH